jgi:hypothetical protein
MDANDVYKIACTLLSQEEQNKLYHLLNNNKQIIKPKIRKKTSTSITLEEATEYLLKNHFKVSS